MLVKYIFFLSLSRPWPILSQHVETGKFRDHKRIYLIFFFFPLDIRLPKKKKGMNLGDRRKKEEEVASADRTIAQEEQNVFFFF